MGDLEAALAPVSADGIEAILERDWHVAALRYFAVHGDLIEALAKCGLGLPALGQAVEARGPGGAHFLLAARSPTETWVMTRDGAAFGALAAQLAPCVDGCLVDQSGGLWPVRVRGARIEELLTRIGSTAALVAAGAAHVTRIAELTVMVAAPGDGAERLLLVDRVYAPHLFGWIRATVADL